MIDEFDTDKGPIRAFLSRRLLVMAAAGSVIVGCASAADQPRTIRQRIADRRAQRMGANAGAGAPTGRLTDANALKGDFAVVTELGEFVDASRGGRKILWKSYLPSGASKAPVVIYSHGGGGTLESGRVYGEHLASHGIGALHIQHIGTDRDAFRENPQQISEAARNPKAGAPRYEDVGFVVRELRRGGPFGSRIDAARLGVAGHSLGAITTLIAAGQFVEGYGQSLAAPDIKGAFALSPSPPRKGYGDAATAFDKMLAPIFHLTGTEDDAPNGDFQAPARRIPFDETTNVDQRLLILKGANHFTFGGDPDPQLRGRSFSYPGLERHHDLIKAASVLFWRSIFNSDAAAKQFLDGGAFKALLGPDDTLEFKPAR
jgi:predicted dienelactone hydrolase